MENQERKLNLEEIENLVQILGGDKKVRQILSGVAKVEIKYPIAIDGKGCFLGLDGSEFEYNQEYLDKPFVFKYKRLGLLAQAFPGLEFPDWLTFTKESKKLLRQLKSDPVFDKLLQGVWFPVAYPKVKIDDYGTAIQEIFLKGLSNSYQHKFPGRTINFPYDLVGKTQVVDSGHRRLLERMEKGPVVGLQFFPFRGMSFAQAQEIAAVFPRRIILAGPVGMITALAGYPDMLLKGYSELQFQCGAATIEGASKASFSTLYIYVDHYDTLHCVRGDAQLKNVNYAASIIYLAEE